MFFAITSYVTGIASILIGVFVFLKKPESSLTKLFSFLTFSVAIYSIFLATAVISRTPEEAIFWMRIEHIGNAFIPTAYLHFSLSVIKETKRWKPILILSYIFSILLVPAVFTKLWIGGVRENFVGLNYYPAPGPLYVLYFLMYSVIFSFAQIVVFRASRRLKGRESKQAFFVFLTGFVGSIPGAITFLPLYGFEVAPNLNSLAILYLLALAYAILKHGLLDIPVLVKKALIFTTLFAVVSGFLAFVLFLGTDVLQQKFGGQVRWWSIAAAAAIVVLTFRKLDIFLVNITDRFLFQKKLDYRKVLKAASTGLSHVNSLRYQLKLITYFLTRRTRIKIAAVYMPENGNGENGKHDFILQEFRAFDASQFGHDRLAFDSQIVTYLRKEKRKPYLELYEIDGLARRHKKDMANLYRYDFGEIRSLMNQMKAFLIVPSYYQDRLQGILMLGEKRSEEPYTEEDINLFQTIAQETAIAFENARKHDKLVAQKEELAKANEKLKEAQAEIIQAKEEAAVAELSGGISHDVNNGIYAQSDANERIEEALSNLSNVFKELYDSNEPISSSQKVELFQYLEDAMVAVKQSEDAGKHIEDVARTLSQIAKGERAQMSRLNLRTFISGMVRIGALRTYSNRLRAQAFEEEPEVVMPNDLPSIRGHAQLLKGVFINLFKNAIDAMNNISPKKLKIAAMRDPEDQDMVRIEFSDNGCGISKEHLPHIFDYEFTTKGQHGEGKGLFNVKSIIENEHKGKIEVESELGKGTTFILKIPIYKAGVHDL